MKTPSKPRSRLWSWGIQLVIFLVVITGIRLWQHRDLPVGVAPSFTAYDVEGKPVSLSDYRGKPVMLHFWATWCSVCRLEQSSIDAIAKTMPVLTVAMQSGDAADVSKYMREQGLQFKAVPDAGGDLSAHYGIRGVPTTFILDGDGRIRFLEVGYTTGLGLRARLWWAEHDPFGA